MKIGLIDVDSHNFPNLPLMKLSAFHKRNGDEVKFYEPLVDVCDQVYMSKVFTFTPDYCYPIQSKVVIQGGTGYGTWNNLLPEIENIYPDYSLYGINDVAYGFLTRGCPRHCGFCIVSAKEGLCSTKVANLDSFWRGQNTIKLLDPNLLACVEAKDLLLQLIKSNAWIDFTQGLDIRLVDEEVSALIMQCKVKMIHFAWDSEESSQKIIEKLKLFKKITNIDRRKAAVYVLTNYDTHFEFDLERIYRIRDLGYDPYVMIYEKENASDKYYKLQRWVNSKRIFRTVDKFDNYFDGRNCVGRNGRVFDYADSDCVFLN